VTRICIHRKVQLRRQMPRFREGSHHPGPHWSTGALSHDWRRTAEEGGRELVCALAAFGPDINSPGDCPADLMPPWLAEMVPVLDDGIAEADVPWFMGQLLTRAKAWASSTTRRGSGSAPAT
jgi:hypothetical protein